MPVEVGYNSEVLGDPLFRPGSPGGLMQCPSCGFFTPDAWKRLIVQPKWSPSSETNYDLDKRFGHGLELDWMACANDECGQVVVRAHETSPTGLILDHGIVDTTTLTWNVHPRHNTRPLNPLVGEREPDIARDYTEAVAILDISHRMSAVLARRVLADLLEKYAGQTQQVLADQIRAFTADSSHPSGLRENLDYLREIANFGAHTQKNDQLERIDISPEEAEWTLSIVERLFDYFIVGPETDRKLKAGMDAKLTEATGKRPINPPDPEVPSKENDGEEEAPADRTDPEGS